MTEWAFCSIPLSRRLILWLLLISNWNLKNWFIVSNWLPFTGHTFSNWNFLDVAFFRPCLPLGAWLNLSKSASVSRQSCNCWRLKCFFGIFTIDLLSTWTPKPSILFQAEFSFCISFQPAQDGGYQIDSAVWIGYCFSNSFNLWLSF